jgi:hypothetical protein
LILGTIVPNADLWLIFFDGGLTSDAPPAWMAMTLLAIIFGTIAFFILRALLPVTEKGLQRKVYRNFGGDLKPLHKALKVKWQSTTNQKQCVYSLLDVQAKLNVLVNRALKRDQKSQATYLVGYLYRRDRIAELLRECEKRQPHRGWYRYESLHPPRGRDPKIILQARFDAQELRALCREFRVDYDRNLKGHTHAKRVNYLVGYCYRRDCAKALRRAGKRQRSDINWDELNFRTPKRGGRMAVVIADRFDDLELHAFCASLEVDYNHLKGSTLQEKAEALVQKHRDPRGWYKLRKIGQQERPDIQWLLLIH